MLWDLGLEISDQDHGSCCTVIDMYQDNDHGLALTMEEHCLVDVATHEAKMLQHYVDKTLVPLVAWLLKIVQSLLEMTNEMRGVGDMVTGWLRHVDDFAIGEFSIEICTFDVNLMHFHVICSCHCEDRMNCCKFGNWHECIKIVDAWDLWKALGNEMDFVVDDIAHSILLSPEDLFWANNIWPNRHFSKLPSSGLVEGFEFLLDGLLP